MPRPIALWAPAVLVLALSGCGTQDGALGSAAEALASPSAAPAAAEALPIPAPSMAAPVPPAELTPEQVRADNAAACESINEGYASFSAGLPGAGEAKMDPELQAESVASLERLAVVLDTAAATSHGEFPAVFQRSAAAFRVLEAAIADPLVLKVDQGLTPEEYQRVQNLMNPAMAELESVDRIMQPLCESAGAPLVLPES